jgi:hypothetical protein
LRDRAWFAPVMAAGFCLLILLSGTAVFGVAQTLPNAISAVFRVIDLDRDFARGMGGILMTHVDGPPDGVGRGIQLTLLCVLIGGMPSAIAALVLARHTRRRTAPWPGGTAGLFYVGLVFQLCSVAIAAFVSIVVMSFWGLVPEVRSGLQPILAGLVLTAVCGALALPAWRYLGSRTADGPPRLFAR